MGRKIAKITAEMNEGRLLEDLERYRAKAIALGATKAVILKTEDIPVLSLIHISEPRD